MKYFTCTIIALCVTLINSASFALNHTQEARAFDHLLEVNKEWRAHSDLSSSNSISFKSDNERIRYHLLNVESILRIKSTQHLTKKQRENRQKMLAVLNRYALDMQFPINTFHDHRKPYFIDIFQTHCAVGFLVMKSGHGDISKRISETQNYAYVREIDSPELLQWSTDYGFTLDELAWIQPAYSDETPYYPVGTGTNGRVRFIDRANASSDTYIAGDFTMLGDLPCLNVAVYDGNQLACLGGGLDGIINGLTVQKNSIGQELGVLVVGRFEVDGVVYPIAKFHNDAWEYISIPYVTSLDIEATCIQSTPFNFAIGMRSENTYFAMNFSTIFNTWSRYGDFNGPVYTIDWENQLFAGDFTKIYNQYYYYDEEDNPVIVQDTILTKNVAILDYIYLPNGVDWVTNWIGITENVPDIVYTSAQIGLNTYLGGKSNGPSTGNDIILARVFGGNSQPMIRIPHLNSTNAEAIYSLEANPSNSQLIIGGSLNQNYTNYVGDMSMGQHLYSYNLTTGYVTVRGYFDEPVYAVEANTGLLMLGGDFNSSAYSPLILNHLAKNELVLGIDELLSNVSIAVFPNPTTSEIRIDGLESAESWFEITDINGRTVLPKQIYQGSIQVSNLENGTYFIKIMNAGSSDSLARFVKM